VTWRFRAGLCAVLTARTVPDCDRRLDRTYLLLPTTLGRTRPVDRDRIRHHHDHAGRSGRGTDTVTFQCSRPELLRLRIVGQSAAIRQALM
jgi:hypothetical protein